MLDFLRDIVAAVPDPSAGGTINIETAGASSADADPSKKKRRPRKKKDGEGEGEGDADQAPQKRRRKKKEDTTTTHTDGEMEGEPEEEMVKSEDGDVAMDRSTIEPEEPIRIGPADHGDSKVRFVPARRPAEDEDEYGNKIRAPSYMESDEEWEQNKPYMPK